MAELHDIVDENDTVIGQTTFDDAYANNKIIRVAHLWVMNSTGKFLFQFRGAHKKSSPRRFDASVGGRLDVGETYEQAVVREAVEELGLKLSVPPIYAGKTLIQKEHTKFFGVYYAYSDGPFKNWEAEAELLEWMSYPEYRSLYERFPYLFAGTETLELVQQALASSGHATPITK
ncbi:MAG: NUDIX domain-containing protein [Bdellovibrionales bacterium]